MATGGTAPPIIMANNTHSLLDQDSTVSSPLSDLMDSHEMEVDSDDEDLRKPEHAHADGPAHPPSHDTNSDSLSDIDTNDSEAETERLDITPRKGTNGQSIATAASANNQQEPSVDKITRAFQRSPSKLQEQIRADVEAESGGDDDLSDQHDVDDEDRASAASSSDEGTAKKSKTSQSLRKKSQESHIVASSTAVGSRSDSSVESRKRKRSPLPDQSNANVQPRERSGSAVGPSAETSPLSKMLSEDLAPTHSTEGKSSGEDEDTAMIDVEDVAESVEKPTIEPSRPKKSKRANTKKRKASEEEVPEEAPGVEELPAEEVADETVEVDEEAQEAAHRNEEECKNHSYDPFDSVATDQLATVQRKRNAFDQLSGIEKHFAILRDRLYEERLAQLNEEEAQLSCENPTHPEYLAMMQCIDSRRDEKLRVSELEYKFNMDALERWAVARRSQILTQFYQSVRESREKTLEELGKQWYEIQHERRKNANPIPDFGYRFPKTKAQQKRQVVAHSKETSILAGIAQHHGFPAAPDIKSASQAEVDEDFEAMHVSRRILLSRRDF